MRTGDIEINVLVDAVGKTEKAIYPKEWCLAAPSSKAGHSRRVIIVAQMGGEKGAVPVSHEHFIMFLSFLPTTLFWDSAHQE